MSKWIENTGQLMPDGFYLAAIPCVTGQDTDWRLAIIDVEYTSIKYVNTMPAGIDWQDIEWFMPLDSKEIFPNHAPFSTPLFGGEPVTEAKK